MERLDGLSAIPPAPEGRSIAVGTFDGVHLGHRHVIAGAAEWGRAHGARVAVVTFDPHPLQVLQASDPPALLTPPSLKADLIADLDVDELVFIHFTESFSRTSAERFCEDVLARTLAARHVSVGTNFRFGHEAQGDVRLLEGRAEFDTAVVPLVERDGSTVSSTRIRGLLGKGHVSDAAGLLGAPFQLEGEVVEGDRRGRSLGVPTANLRPRQGFVVPAAGVYAGRVLERPAAINIGVRPTFERDGELLVEAHLVDFDADLYGETLRLEFLERLRDEQRFESADALVAEMRRDIELTKQIAAER